MMICLNRILRDRRDDGERGVALALVVGIAAVLFVLVAMALTFSVGAMSKATSTTSSNAAIAAAYAGVSDYQARLTNDNTYQRYGDPTAPFSASTGSATLVLPPTNPDGTPGNPAFGYGTSGAWAPVPGATGNAAFRYEVDNSQYGSQGIIRLLATGRSGNQTRSFVANIRQKGFLDYLYFTDYEVQDPALTGDSQSGCTQYYPARSDTACGGAIQFGSGETINGPLDSNDALYICGGTFNGTVTSNYATSPYYRNCGTATFNQGAPKFGPKLTMPPTNTAMKNETRGDLTSTTVPRPGCLYTGPTSIVFHSDGTMTVKSPWSVYMNTSATGGMPTVPANVCGTAGAGGLGSLLGQTITVPAQNLIYVQTVPSVSTDPNYWAPTAAPPLYAACPANGNDLGYPVNTTTVVGGKTVVTTETTTSSAAGNYYGCRTGDAFVQGTLHGQVTIAAENYVWVTGDLTYSDNSSDVLGLVGQNAVWVWNPVGTIKTGGTTSGSAGSPVNLLSDSGRSINAAILSVAHTFQVQNFSVGGYRGQLSVLGAIAQKYRGTVGTGNGSTGYLKNYSYDVRFRSVAPPKFLQAVSTTYGISQLAEVTPAFNVDGSSH
jgi:hypothetical protein